MPIIRPGGYDPSRMTFDEAGRTIESEFAVALGNPERVGAACAALLAGLGQGLAPESLTPLAVLLGRRSGPILRPLFTLLDQAARLSSRPIPILIGLLGVRDAALCRQALDRIVELVEVGCLGVEKEIISALAEKVEAEGSPLADVDSLSKIGRILRRASIAGPRHGVEPSVELYIHGPSRAVRRLAARLLDIEKPPPPKRMEAMLGFEAYRFLAPYLAYSQSTHLDLLDLAGSEGLCEELLASLTSAEVRLGERLLREVIVSAGWSRLNRGLEVRERIGISVDESFPLAVSPAEASLIESCTGARRTWRRFLVLAHGGGTERETNEVSPSGPVHLFRASNLAHAEALGEILSAEPLSRERIRRIIGLLDRIVKDFVSLFSSLDEEAAALPEVYGKLRDSVLEEVAKTPGDALSAHLSRLVLMFEDPRALAEVRTLHGLKRYLHQKGLRLGFRLVETGHATNRTVDLLLVGAEKVPSVVRKIQYVDFEPAESGQSSETGIPYPVRIVAEGIGRHLLHEFASFPDVRIFCYGNEVHYYASYGTHPAFLRIDFAPPVRGGMIDLEYYGVSKNDLDRHPAPALDAVQLFFRGMDFDCAVARTRVHARYDKERARDLGDICAKAEVLFRLLPLLMDIDWVIGSLRLDEDARAEVALAWRDFFFRWGVLPIESLLTADRLGIRTGIAPDPAGGKEIVWSGRGVYQDRFSARSSSSFAAEVEKAIVRRGLLDVVPCVGTTPAAFGQIPLEMILLGPLRGAVERGELLEGPSGFEPATDRFRREHEAMKFAEVLNGGDAPLVRAAELARVIGGIERSLRFQSAGNVNGYEVGRADLELRGENASVYVLRDRSGMARLAIFAREGRLYSLREAHGAAWRFNGVTDAAHVMPLLRRASYLTAGVMEPAPEDAHLLRSLFAAPNPLGDVLPVAGERVLPGVRAAPGKAAGPAVLGTRGRVPGDLDGSILIAASICPDDNAFIYRSAGVVSTGGGILSHAGLLAMQFRKPALLIDARWGEGGRYLVYKAVEYEEVRSRVGSFAVAARMNLREREERIVEGDILALDVEQGLLRNLGHEPDALALHEGLRQMIQTGRSLERTTDDARLLALRGRRLRARHQLERLFMRLQDSNLARHAVRELFSNDTGVDGAGGENASLVALLLENRSVAAAARDCVAGVLRELEGRRRDCESEAHSRIPMTEDPHEVLSLRLDCRRIRNRLNEALRLAAASGLPNPPGGIPLEPESDEIDALAWNRLVMIRDRLMDELGLGAEEGVQRHLLRRIEAMESVLGPCSPRGIATLACARVLEDEDRQLQVSLGDRPILHPDDGGLELARLIGMKAANLSEIDRILGAGFVPDWFVVTDAAFRAVLDGVVETEGGSIRLCDAIETILQRVGTNEAQKSFLIHKLLGGIRIPEAIEAAIVEAYRRLATEQAPGVEEREGGVLVAVRSSGREEDTEDGARAGEFDTFLFVRGERELIDAIRRAWGGLWSERAIHNRAVLGVARAGSGGGVLVQRICWSRASGVLTTINVGDGRMREIVVSAGLGLGEGIVSGEVGADLIVVSKEGIPEGEPLRFRYLTNDKREKVVFDRRRGQGTIRVETQYHERFRPALEYVELCELVLAATRLERTYGYPLDIEFGIEGDRIRILQARPVARTAAILRETIDHHPLHAPRKGRGEGKERR